MIKKHTAVLTLFFIAAIAIAGCGPEKGEAEPQAPKAAEVAENEGTLSEAAATPSTDPKADELKKAGDEVVATVNGRPITRRLLENMLALGMADNLIQARPDEAAEDPQVTQLRLEMLEGLILMEVAAQEAIRRGYAPSDDEVDAAIKDYFAGMAVSEDMEETLAGGRATEELRAQIGGSLAVAAWQDKDFLAAMAVPENEARAFYEQNKDMMSHNDMMKTATIFIAVPLAATNEVKKRARGRAEAALARVKKGEDFEAVAFEVSQAPDSKTNKGVLGWVEKERTMPIFDAAVFALKPEEISGIVESPMGFNIFKALEFKPAGVESYVNMRARIVDFLSGEKQAAAVKARISDLRHKAEVKILDEKLEAAFDAAVSGAVSVPAS